MTTTRAVLALIQEVIDEHPETTVDQLIGILEDACKAEEQEEKNG